MKKMFSILFVLVLVVSLGVVTAAPVLAGATIHVPGDYPTIQAAIDAAGPGDTIMVAAGTYAGFQVIEKTNIRIIGAEGATVTTANLIEGVPVVGKVMVMAAVFDSQNINIEGINFDGAGVNGIHVCGIVYVDSTGRIADLTVKNIIGTELGAGVAIIGYAGTSTVEMKGATISNNYIGIFTSGNSTLEAHFNNIVGNSEFGVLNYGGGTVDATHNWWGAASGPYHPTANPGGTGNAVSDNVNFNPWLGSGVAGVVTKTVKDDTVDAKKEADTEVVVKGEATVIVARYEDNPGGPPPTGSSSLNPLDKYIDVSSNDTTEVTETEIKLYYYDGEVAGFDEESLQLFWLDGDEWNECSDSGVNTGNTNGYSGYMWAKITATTTPSLADLQGTPFGGYGHPTEIQPPCCMATVAAASGTNTASKLGSLRQFRDTVLLPNSLGARFVSLYYEISPPIADFISQHEVLRTAVRVGFVDPIVAILNWSHDLWSTRGS